MQCFSMTVPEQRGWTCWSAPKSVDRLVASFTDSLAMGRKGQQKRHELLFYTQRGAHGACGQALDLL